MKMKILRQFFRTSASVNKLYKLVLMKAEGKKSSVCGLANSASVVSVNERIGLAVIAEVEAFSDNNKTSTFIWNTS